MVNHQKGVQQDTDYSAVVVNDHNYASPSLYPKRVIETWKTYIGRDRYTYYHTLQRYLYYRQFLVIKRNRVEERTDPCLEVRESPYSSTLHGFLCVSRALHCQRFSEILCSTNTEKVVYSILT